MSYASGQAVPWPVPPDWRSGVSEPLGWLTDYMQAINGEVQKRQLRQAPRRGFSFDVIADGQGRRALDAMLFDQGGKVWALPIWHDIQLLATAAVSGADTIACRTDGFEFVAGGQAMLWAGLNSFELVTLDSIASGTLTLDGTLASGWPAGTRLYPVVNARNLEASEEQAWHDQAGTRRVTFVVDGPCDWPAVLPSATYRSYPVLEHRTDEKEDPTSSYGRQIDSVDDGIGLVSYFDYVDAPFPVASHQWLLGNRSEHAAFRSLLYGLAGRAATLWVPAMRSQLVLASTLASASTAMVVEWAGYTLFGRQQSNRRDIRIELRDGTVLYRRITDSSEGSGVETLTLDSAPGIDIAPGAVQLICFMALSELASDTAELEHITDADGITRCTLQFKGVKHAL